MFVTLLVFYHFFPVCLDYIIIKNKRKGKTKRKSQADKEGEQETDKSKQLLANVWGNESVPPPCHPRFPAAYTYSMDPQETGLVATGLIPAVAPVLSSLPTAGSLITDRGWRSQLYSLIPRQEQSLLWLLKCKCWGRDVSTLKTAFSCHGESFPGQWQL